MTDYPGEQFPPAVDPDVEPGFEPDPDEQSQPDYDSEPGPESQHDRPTSWVNPTLQGRPHTDPLLAGFTVYGDPTPDPVEDTEQTFEASLDTHSYVDDGPEDWPADTAEEPADAADEPAAPAPAAHAVETAGDEEPSHWAPAGDVSADEVPAPAAPAVGEPARPVPTPGQAFGRGPVPGAPRPVASSPVPSPSVVAASAGATPSAAPVGEAADGVRDEDGVHPLVEEVMGRLEGLRERPVGEHAEVFADLHERLQSALVEADAEHGDRG